MFAQFQMRTSIYLFYVSSDGISAESKWSQRERWEKWRGWGDGVLSQQRPLSNGPFKCLRARLAALFSMPLRRSSAVKRVPVQTAPALLLQSGHLCRSSLSVSPKSFKHLYIYIHIYWVDGLRGACIHTISKLLLPLGGVVFAPIPDLLFICDHQRASWLQHVCLCVRPTPTRFRLFGPVWLFAYLGIFWYFASILHGWGWTLINSWTRSGSIFGPMCHFGLAQLDLFEITHSSNCIIWPLTSALRDYQ